MCVNMEACVSLQRRIFSEPGKFTLVSRIPSRNKLSTVANIALDPGGWKYPAHYRSSFLVVGPETVAFAYQ